MQQERTVTGDGRTLIITTVSLNWASTVYRYAFESSSHLSQKSHHIDPNAFSSSIRIHRALTACMHPCPALRLKPKPRACHVCFGETTAEAHEPQARPHGVLEKILLRSGGGGRGPIGFPSHARVEWVVRDTSFGVWVGRPGLCIIAIATQTTL